MPRTFAYLRVSTTDQTTNNQLQEIAAAGFKVEPRGVITETGSGNVATAQRRGFTRLLDGGVPGGAKWSPGEPKIARRESLAADLIIPGSTFEALDPWRPGGLIVLRPLQALFPTIMALGSVWWARPRPWAHE